MTIKVARDFYKSFDGKYYLMDMWRKTPSYRGSSNVLAENKLATIAYNINKLHWRIQLQKTEIRLYELKRAV